MLYLTCTTITSIDLAHNGVSRAKDWVSVDCGTMYFNHFIQVYEIERMSFWLPTKMTQFIFHLFLFETQVYFICLKLANDGHH